MTTEATVPTEVLERPAGFVPPDLRPRGLELLPQELAPGVHALMANRPPKDNNGVIVGDRAALVVDSGVTPTIGRQILQRAAELTDRPVRYVANTTFHGDHSFGNTAFDEDVVVVSSSRNKAAMHDLEHEKRARSGNMHGEDSLDEVTSWRLPDMVFDRWQEIDLGGRLVRLHHFGPGNGIGDTMVHVPDAKVVWTGNFLVPQGFVPMMLIGDPLGYTGSVEAMRAEPDMERFVPGHGIISETAPAFDWLLHYLRQVHDDIERAHDEGWSLDEALERCQIPTGFPPPAGGPAAAVAERTNPSLHRLNILATYRTWSSPNSTPLAGRSTEAT